MFFLCITPNPGHNSQFWNIQGAATAPTPSVAPVSEDEFSSEDAMGEQETVMKAIKFPEVEAPSKLAGAAPKVAKCLEKRTKNLKEMLDKFASHENLTDLQRTLLSCLGTPCWF